LYDDVIGALTTPKERPFVRFNFLVHSGRVFFLEAFPWWHTVPGDARKVVERLRKDGVRVILVKCLSSRASWTPYFGRKHDEVPKRGWNDLTVKVKARLPQHAHILRTALRAHREYLGKLESVP
jgi:predicted nuclease with RNAse H fold